MPPELLKSWIDGLQPNGRYSFLRSEAVHDSGLTPNAVSKALRQAARDGRIVRLKEYAYVIVTLEYRTASAPPSSWFIHDLMKPTGLMHVSTPETTVVDLVRFSKAAGHLDHVAALIAEWKRILPVCVQTGNESFQLSQARNCTEREYIVTG